MAASFLSANIRGTSLNSTGFLVFEKLRILISHTNFPAQFRRLGPELVHRVMTYFLAKNREWHAPKPSARD